MSKRLNPAPKYHFAATDGVIPQGRPEIVRITAIRPNPGNPRSHSRQQRRAMARSLSQLGYNAPILIDAFGMIVAGELRYEALKMLGVEEVLVVRLGHLTPEQIEAYIIADNRLAELAGWDDPKLAKALKRLCGIALTFDIEVTGFETPEIELRIQSLDPPEETDADDDVEVPNGEPVSRPGDLWRLGRNHILCASALETSSYDTLLAGLVCDAATMSSSASSGARAPTSGTTPA